MSSTADTLNAAADLIERDGWWQGGMGPEAAKRHGFGGKCAITALVEASGDCNRADRIAERLGLYLTGDESSTDVIYWNDHRDRTQAQVVEAMRACAVIEEARAEREAHRAARTTAPRDAVGGAR